MSLHRLNPTSHIKSYEYPKDTLTPNTAFNMQEVMNQSPQGPWHSPISWNRKLVQPMGTARVSKELARQTAGCCPLPGYGLLASVFFVSSFYVASISHPGLQSCHPGISGCACGLCGFGCSIGVLLRLLPVMPITPYSCAKSLA